MKILACIAVVGLHTLHKDISIVNQSLYYICGFAVPAFFMSTGYVLLNRDGVHNNYSWNKIKKILHVVFLWSLLISISYLFWRVIKNELNLQVLIVLPKTFFWRVNSARISMAFLVYGSFDYYIRNISVVNEI
ncbi:hypothetical protein DXA17_18395 [Ruminococcus sp. AM58-7XD]|nr:hypothetical protein DXA17_18395 [Ruminococcus sp. AM58-7XD]